jgi:hypothetical protein
VALVVLKKGRPFVVLGVLKSGEYVVWTTIQESLNDVLGDDGAAWFVSHGLNLRHAAQHALDTLRSRIGVYRRLPPYTKNGVATRHANAERRA